MTTSEVPPPNTARRWVGANLRHLRTSQGLTLEQLAERVTALGFGIDKASLSRIENGRTNVDVEKLLAFAQALDVAPDRLLRDPQQLDRALYERLRRRWYEVALDIRRLGCLASVLMDDLEVVAAGIPGAADDLEQTVFEVSRVWWRLGIERPPVESERYADYLEALLTAQAFSVEVDTSHEDIDLSKVTTKEGGR